MRIFLSYAAEDGHVASEIAHALRLAGHDVFFAPSDIRGGDDYLQILRGELEQMGFFVFLLSPHSIEPGNFALTELRAAREKWKKPVGHILPVLVQSVEGQRIPADLVGISHLEPAGNVPAETVTRVNAMSRRRRWRSALPALAVVCLGAAGGGIMALESWVNPPAQRWCFAVSRRMVFEGVTTHRPCFNSRTTCEQTARFAKTTTNPDDGRPRTVGPCKPE